MPRRTKLQRYQDILSLPNVSSLHHYRHGDHAPVRGNWKEVFGNSNPITLELACGKGEYATGLAERFPDRNFLGLDIKGDRIWKGARHALERELGNVHFLRTRIDHIANYFAPGEVEEIWITFPDPFLKKNRRRKRLTHPEFLNRYYSFLQPDGTIHLKTDSDRLFDFTHDVIKIFNLPVRNVIPDIYGSDRIPETLRIQTYYEKKHVNSGKSIKYIAFGLNDSIRDFNRPELDQLT